MSFNYSFIDLFAGIGGFRIPFEEMGCRCVFTSEMDRAAKETYALNFGEEPNGDITEITSKMIPDHDILLAGFPCQAFSNAGRREGFMDTRGTLFFEIQRIMANKLPNAFILENVKTLKNHKGPDGLKTFDVMKGILEGKTTPNKEEIEKYLGTGEALKTFRKKLDYSVSYSVLNAKDFGRPQNRERLFIVGVRKKFLKEKDLDSVFNWPSPWRGKGRVGDILEHSLKKSERDRYTISDRLWQSHQDRKERNRKNGKGFGFRKFSHDDERTSTLSARYYKDGAEILIDQGNKNPRKLTPRECARLQGFPEDFRIHSSDQQAYRQFGNAVNVWVVRSLADKLLETMKNLKIPPHLILDIND